MTTTPTPPAQPSAGEDYAELVQVIDDEFAKTEGRGTDSETLAELIYAAGFRRTKSAHEGEIGK